LRNRPGDDSGNNERARIAHVPGIMLIVWPIARYVRSRE
jgi:hypothetical protein